MTISYLIHITLLFFILLISSINSCKWSPTQCGCAHTPPSLHQRIVGGVAAKEHSWPWIVAIRQYNSHLCGGVLISDRHVLTAAHCFLNYHPSMINAFTFAMGHHGRSENIFISKAKRIINHKSYDSNGRNIHDIALVELDRIIDFNNKNIGFICLPSADINNNGIYPPLGTPTWVVGWGHTSFHGTPSTVLLQVSVPITNNKGCTAKVTLPAKQLCAGLDQGGKDSCQGDSGGPLVLDKGQGIFELIGIVSFGEGCAYVMKPGIYTRVSGYIDWINDLVKKPITHTANTSNTPHTTVVLPQALLSNGNQRKLSCILFIFSSKFIINFK
ncbi:unnamed protein product [Adineta steineri]|uniref:Peptidase S1 domain-containing protein n=1 Tax=Adineta steineri TaxID=433720 RepID=A0A814LGV2_9BILA|nr:unnamed protein product [Adineta steineri]